MDSRNPLKRNKLYDKYLKSKTNENEKEYKTYKYLFEVLKEKSKKIYNSRKLENCKQNMKKNVRHIFYCKLEFFQME